MWDVLDYGRMRLDGLMDLVSRLCLSACEGSTPSANDLRKICNPPILVEHHRMLLEPVLRRLRIFYGFCLVSAGLE